MKITATRYHDFSTGHRVYGHESKCSHLHGHNYRIYFTLQAEEGYQRLDQVGRVIDFSVIKTLLCDWLEDNWDHKFLVWDEDPFSKTLAELDPTGVVITSFNPTAENMGLYLMKIAEAQLYGTGVKLINVRIEETRKCSVDVAE